jgi:hypothetical protein
MRSVTTLKSSNISDLIIRSPKKSSINLFLSQINFNSKGGHNATDNADNIDMLS